MVAFSSGFFTLGALMGGVALTSAQISVSSQCQAGFTGLLVNPDAACLNPGGLLGILTAGSNTSLSGPVNNYLTGLCSQPACTNATLASVFANITADCQNELNSLGLGNISSAQLTTLLQSAFPIVKAVGCLKDTANNTLCVTEDIKTLEATTGPLTIPALEQFLSAVVNSGVPPLPNSAKCNDCSKASFNIITQNFPGVINSDAQTNIQQTCGASFVDGSAPSDITQTANNGTSTPSTGTNNHSSAALLSSPGVLGAAFSALMTVASLFTVVV